MANKRMFSNQITNSDIFLDMGLSAQALYFHLNMNADDDGFVSPKRIMRMLGSPNDDIKLLIMKGFVLPFDDGVVVITHRKINNNQIRLDRYKTTMYQNHLEILKSTNKVYSLELVGVQDDDKMDTVGTLRVDKSRVDKNRISNISSKEDRTEKSSYGKNYINDFLANVEEIYQNNNIISDLSNRKYASHWIKEEGIAKTKIAEITKLGYAGVFEFIDDILKKAKAIKYGNYVDKVTDLYGLWKNYPKILNLTNKELSKEKQPTTFVERELDIESYTSNTGLLDEKTKYIKVLGAVKFLRSLGDKDIDDKKKLANLVRSVFGDELFKKARESTKKELKF